MVWDTTQPMFVYNEETVMSFIDYICYCGGLVGLLFGASAVDILYIIFSKTTWIIIWTITLQIIQKAYTYSNKLFSKIFQRVI